MNADEFNERDTGLSLQTFIHVFTIAICTMKKVTLEGLAIKCWELQKVEKPNTAVVLITPLYKFLRKKYKHPHNLI